MQLQPPPKKFLSTLLEVRDYYAPMVEKYGKLYREALENLNHVEALLSNWSLTLEVGINGSKGEVGEEIFTPSIPKSLNGNGENISVTEPELLKSKGTELPDLDNFARDNGSSPNREDVNLPLDSSDTVAPAGENLSSDESEDIPEIETKSHESNAHEGQLTSDKATLTPNNNDNIVEVSSELVEPSTTEPSLAENQEKAKQPSNKSLLGSDIPMLSEYQSLRRIEAVQKLLQKHTGSVCHIDFVVRSLYGELELDVWKVVKGRVQSTLTQGRESNKWSLVPGKPGYYTIDLKLLNTPRKDASSKQSTTKNKKPDPQAKTNSIPMKGEFAGKFVIDAITLLLQKNPRKVFDVAEVINKLYGHLEPEQVQEVKPKVLNELSRGYRTGRFSRVPEEKGLYIWDSKYLPE
jgi:hypothetical protein